MTRIVSGIALLAIALARPARAEQQHGQLDGSETLFTVMAALNAGGYDYELDSPVNHPLRFQVRKELAAKKLAVMDDLRYFMRKHHRDNPIADLSQYISFALSLKGPPDFDYRFRTIDLPPDVEAMQGFSDILVRFYREADIEEMWNRVQPAYDQVIEKYHEPVSQAILQVNGYLRNATSGYLGRRFQIYLDLVGPPNQIQVRGYADDFLVVITPSLEPQINDIRNAYLSYLIDPTALKYSEIINRKKPLIDFAQNAPLPEIYKSDFLLLLSKSLIKAVEARLTRGHQQELVDKALKEGYILTPFFAEQLPLYEKQEDALKGYFPDMVKAIDLKTEATRLEHVQFAAAPAVRLAKIAPAPAAPEKTAGQKLLDDAENLYDHRDLEKAKAAYNRVLRETDQKTLHASSYYGLARIAALEKDPELAERLFQKTLESEPEPWVRAWAEVYLGRLSDAAGAREEAAGHYRQALAVEGASEKAKEAAQKGVQQGFQK